MFYIELHRTVSSLITNKKQTVGEKGKLLLISEIKKQVFVSAALISHQLSSPDSYILIHAACCSADTQTQSLAETRAKSKMLNCWASPVLFLYHSLFPQTQGGCPFRLLPPGEC